LRKAALKCRDSLPQKSGPSRNTKKSPSRSKEWEGKKSSLHVGFHKDPYLPEWNIQNVSPNPRYLHGMRVRNSKRWYAALQYPTVGYSVPYIDELGRFSGCTLYNWNTDPRAIVSSITSTIYQRLMKFSLRHNHKRLVYRASQLLLKCAGYYALSKNSYFMDRVLFFLRNLGERKNLIHKFYTRFACKLNDSRRFVFSQICSQINWLTFRAAKPRDKFSMMGKRTDTSWSNTRGLSLLVRSGFIWEVASEICQILPLQYS